MIFIKKSNNATNIKKRNKMLNELTYEEKRQLSNKLITTIKSLLVMSSKSDVLFKYKQWLIRKSDKSILFYGKRLSNFPKTLGIYYSYEGILTLSIEGAISIENSEFIVLSYIWNCYDFKSINDFNNFILKISHALLENL